MVQPIAPIGSRITRLSIGTITDREEIGRFRRSEAARTMDGRPAQARSCAGSTQISARLCQPTNCRTMPNDGKNVLPLQPGDPDEELTSFYRELIRALTLAARDHVVSDDIHPDADGLPT